MRGNGLLKRDISRKMVLSGRNRCLQYMYALTDESVITCEGERGQEYTLAKATFPSSVETARRHSKSLLFPIKMAGTEVSNASPAKLAQPPGNIGKYRTLGAISYTISALDVLRQKPAQSTP